MSIDLTSADELSPAEEFVDEDEKARWFTGLVFSELYEQHRVSACLKRTAVCVTSDRQTMNPLA